jgi:eukaryotic-like serine/threonine-protein kinase
MSARNLAWQQHVQQPERWAAEHRWLLEEIYEQFERFGDWPEVGAIERSLAARDRAHAIGAAQLLNDMPREIGGREVQRIVLNARGLSHCERARPLLETFVKAIRMASETYRLAGEDGAAAKLSGFRVKEKLSLGDQEYLRLSLLLEREPWVFGNSQGNPGDDWTREVLVLALAFEEVETIGDYLDILARHRFGDPDDGPALDPGPESQHGQSVIVLQREWVLGEQIGEGGFGIVRAASGGEKEAVVKLVPKEPGAQRELLLHADLDRARNVVPLLEHGETAEHLVLVMPRAQMNLREHLQAAGSLLDPPEARRILADIALTLTDLHGRVVHRDIKPENVLLLGGRWCLTDFGISRYAEASTAAVTHKFSMTPAYAAPERFRGERAQSPADIYAVGVIGYEMVAGRQPFPGPEMEDFAEQHLDEIPPQLQCPDAALAALIHECLLKAPQARPTPERLLGRLTPGPPPTTGGGLSRLGQAGAAEASRRAEVDQVLSQIRSIRERHEQLFAGATAMLEPILQRLERELTDAAPAIRSERSPGGALSMRLGRAELQIPVLQAASSEHGGSGAAIPFDLVAVTEISILTPPDQHGYTGRSHSLWFCDPLTEGDYGWFELAFTLNAFTMQVTSSDPFALAPGPEAAQALNPGVDVYQLAWPFTRLDAESAGTLIERVAGWLADGAEGRLHRPGTIPEGPVGNWRRGR